MTNKMALKLWLYWKYCAVVSSCWVQCHGYSLSGVFCWWAVRLIKILSCSSWGSGFKHKIKVQWSCSSKVALFFLGYFFFLPSFAVPVLLNFVLYLYFINNFHFVSRLLLKIRGKTDSKIDLRPHLMKCCRLLFFFQDSLLSLYLFYFQYGTVSDTFLIPGCTNSNFFGIPLISWSRESFYCVELQLLSQPFLDACGNPAEAVALAELLNRSSVVYVPSSDSIVIWNTVVGVWKAAAPQQ